MAEPLWNRRRFLAAAGATAGAVALGACNLDNGAQVDAKGGDDTAGWGDSILIDPGFAKPDVTFTDVDGNPYPLREKTKGRLTILAFGYTSCPDICPVYLNTLRTTQAKLGTGPGSRPIVLFVGVDRKRDTPEKLRSYAADFDNSFVPLTGDESVMLQAINDLKLIPFEIGEPDANGDYLVGHDGRLSTFIPQDDKCYRMYGPDTRQQIWVRDLPRLDRGVYK